MRRDECAERQVLPELRRRATTHWELTDPAVGLGQIVAADPTFDISAFLAQAGNSMLAVKKAVKDREPVDVFDLVTPEIYDQLRMDVEGVLDRGADYGYDMLLSVSQATVAAAEHSAAGDQITVLFRVDTSQPGGEYWTFSRGPVASFQPAARPECPTCGAPIDIDTGRICRYCKTLLPPPNQQKGWTIVAITPTVENA
jgi:hypothetical protein